MSSLKSDILNESSFLQEITKKKILISPIFIICMILIGLSSNKDYVLSEKATVFYSLMFDLNWSNGLHEVYYNEFFFFEIC